MFDLVSATVTGITPTSCATEVIDIERAAVSHVNVDVAITTASTPVKADLSGYSAISD